MSRIDDARVAYQSCSDQIEIKSNFFVDELNLIDNFQTWFSITVLHMWILNARLRQEGPAGKEMRQELFNHLWLDVEIQLDKAGARKNVGTLIKGLIDGYYGQTLAYDEGLAKGDAVLASALYRNVFRANVNSDNKFVNLVELGKLTEYVRLQLQNLENSVRADVLTSRTKFLDL
ncbi:hypothetical protein HK099_008431 [Clydaea vesicula]|uniref:Ubiquinol-cytochrome c chaperone domain-containing protein n=1 Tax=Clydaea vesicula TaxID=447962 RepID=A0AAD5TVD1_9FUNG|nr:hypothetical protein HK099_008431 [Clydaea vesicula]KAJ3392730.1 hypothetical protein HDU92_008233 [Lobulomyces angularis]